MIRVPGGTEVDEAEFAQAIRRNIVLAEEQAETQRKLTVPVGPVLHLLRSLSILPCASAPKALSLLPPELCSTDMIVPP